MQSRDNETPCVEVLRPELGNKLAGPILSFSKPFVVRTKTDSAEPHGGVAINNRGYRLTYKQIPCSVERPNAAAFA